VFIVFAHPLFNDLVSNLLESSPEVEMVGRCADLQDAGRLIAESKAETVVVEGNPSDSRDLSLLNYLLISSRESSWVELVVLSVESNEFACLYRGNVKQLDTKRLLSLILAG
jgi:DNA-binding NarL/FixJ family response regulator